jgi:glycosyltransferase involved in cell wall biosynthesis
MLTHHIDKGGVEQAFINYCEMIYSKGNQVFALIDQRSLFKDQLNSEQTTLITSSILNIPLLNHLYLYFLVRKLAPNVIIVHNGRFAALVKKCCNGARIIGVNHGSEKAKFIGYDHIITVNQNLKELYKQRDIKVTVIPNCIEIDESNQNIRSKRVDSSYFTIGSYGRLTTEKGFDQLIKVAKILKDQGYNFKLVIGGDGYLKPELIKLVKGLSLSDRVEFIGWVYDKQQFFSNIDIFCLPSYNESFGITILEAMHYDVPVVSTMCDGPREIIQHAHNGMLAKDLDTFAKHIITLIEDIDLYLKIQSNAKLDVNLNYNKQRISELIQDILQSNI